MTKHWYKNAIIYSLDVKVFADSNGDGVGDLQGLLNKLDYLYSIGINCLWLLPIYPSPKVDDGYDVKDYDSVDSLIGTLDDFDELLYQARLRGIRVIMDLVVNHTSIEHPWFKEASSSRESPYRDYYIWHDNPDEESEKVIFDESENSIWEYSEPTGSYYLHRYFKEQADLNIANPKVRKEILSIMKFWLDRGVDGFRVDAAHVISDPTHIEKTDYTNLHRFFGDMRELVEEHNPEGVLLGEASVDGEELKKYFTSKDHKPRMHMLFNFLANKHLFLAVARGDGASLAQGLSEFKDVQLSHWLNYVRHHDELNLELLDDDERREVWEAFAPEENMRIFGHGIRRRLPPMVNGDKRKMKLFYAVTFSLPGTAMINYGEEIGMGDNLDLDGRKSVRTPMQWSEEANGGFSPASQEKLYRPAIDFGDYSFKKLNVRREQMNPDSFFNWICMLIRMRTQNPVMGTGDWKILQPDDHRIAAICYESRNSRLLVVFNFSDQELRTSVNLEQKPEKCSEIFSDYPYESEIDLERLQIRPFGFRWIALYSEADVNDLNP